MEHLSKKYGVRKRVEIDKDLLEMMGKLKIFRNDDVETVEIKKPVVVEGLGENVELSVDEVELLKLGPKFCLYVDLKMEEFETDLEECLVKVKWDMMATDMLDKT